MGVKKTHLREVAQMLFLNGIPQKEIAVKLTISEKSISRWAKEDHWDVLKKNILTSKRKRLSELYEELEQFNTMIRDKEGYKVATSKEADARRKLISDIKELEGKYAISQMISIGMDLCEFTKEIDPTLADKLTNIYTAFINQKVEEQKWQD